MFWESVVGKRVGGKGWRCVWGGAGGGGRGPWWGGGGRLARCSGGGTYLGGVRLLNA